MKNKLSVIVPVYNDETNISNSLESLCKQTLKIDIIVVDDGSSDKTSQKINDIILKYPELNIRYYYKENGGISDARNYGLSKVESEYFTFLDSDDYVVFDIYEKMLKQMILENSDICFCDFYWSDKQNNKVIKDTFYKDEKEIIVGMYAVLWNKIYKTEWFKKINLKFPKGLKYEDASLLYRLAPYMKKVSYVKDPCVYYIQREGSITHTFKNNILDMIEVFKGIKNYYLDQGMYEKYKSELEYVFIRFFLGSNFIRACKIYDNNLRNETLVKGYNFLITEFKDFKQNKYLKNKSLKNIYFRLINKNTYKLFSFIFSLYFKIKK